MKTSPFGFSTFERLTKKKIKQLFKSGSSVYMESLCMYYLKKKDSDYEKVNGVLISVPKKKIRKAVDRNLIRRRIREAYRLNKSILFDQPSFYDLGFIYLSEKKMSFQKIEIILVNCLKSLNKIK